MDSIARHIGYLDVGVEAPTFIIPVFRDLDSDQLVVQIASFENCIDDFEALPASTRYIATDSVGIKKIGDYVVFGITVGAEAFPVFGNFVSFKAAVESLLLKGSFDQTPAFGLSVAKFLGDEHSIERFNQQIFAETPAECTRTKKFFIENNIIRESLYRTTPTNQHHLVKKMRISVDNQKIHLGFSEHPSEEEKRSIGENVIKIFSNFTKSSSVEVSFDDQSKKIEYLQGEVRRIKRGKIMCNVDIFDLPYNMNRISIREAIVVIPEVAYEYFNSGRSISNIIRILTAEDIGPPPLSQATAGKIGGFQAVSLVSAVLFRVWAFADIQEARMSTKYLLHICCFRVKAESKDTIKELLRRSNIYRYDTAEKYNILYPISLITFLVQRGDLSIDIVMKNFEYSRIGLPVTQFLNWESAKEWATYCVREFPGADTSFARMLGGKIHMDIS